LDTVGVKTGVEETTFPLRQDEDYVISMIVLTGQKRRGGGKTFWKISGYW